MSHDAAPPRQVCVLLVDDYTDALEVWSLFLDTAGYDVMSAADGTSALASAAARAPDVVVLDLQLPDMSGLEVARRLRRARRTTAVPLIALTGHGLPGEIDEARAAGFNEVLVKPCEPSDLIRAIERSLRGLPPPDVRTRV